MKLAEYLEARGLSYAEFARTIGVKKGDTVRRYAVGERFPRKEHLSAIFRETDGMVTPNDFLVRVAA